MLLLLIMLIDLMTTIHPSNHTATHLVKHIQSERSCNCRVTPQSKYVVFNFLFKSLIILWLVIPTTKTLSKCLQVSLNKRMCTNRSLWCESNRCILCLGWGEKKTAVSNSSPQEISESYGQMAFDPSNAQTHTHSGIT